MQKLKKQVQALDHIGIYEILFDQTEWVTIWGFRLENGRKKELHFITEFAVLNQLLRLSGKEGDQIQMLLVDIIEKGIGEPSILNLEKTLGKPAFLNQCVLEISPTWSKEPSGKLVPDKDCVSLDKAYLPVKKEQKILSSKSKYQQLLTQCETFLARSYDLYLGYLELDVDEKTALKMADIEDDFKFKMAYLSWKLNQKAA